MFKHEEVFLSDNLIIFRYIGDDDIVYQTQKNQFIKNSGLTIKNPSEDIPVYLFPLNQWGSSLICGNLIENLNARLKQLELENIILIMDFDGIKEISENFCEQYFKFLLTTVSKVININQNTSINNTFVNYIDKVVDYQEQDV